MQPNDRGALTFQEWYERAFRFTLSYRERRHYLELDREIQDPDAYREFLKTFPQVEALPFLGFRRPTHKHI